MSQNHRKPSVSELLACSCKYVSPRCGSEAVLSIDSGVEWMKNPAHPLSEVAEMAGINDGIASKWYIYEHSYLKC